MDRAELVAFVRQHRVCVVSTVSSVGWPQSAVVGHAISDEAELVFDSVATTRKVANVRREPRVSVVVGSDEQTLQIDGLADEPTGVDLARLKKTYLATYPDGAAREPAVTYVRVRAVWARFSDYRNGEAITVIAPSELPASEEPVFGRTIPILRIYDYEKMRAHYVDFLGFRIDWEHRFEPGGPVYMQVSREGCVLQLSEHFGDGTPGSKLKVPTRGLDALQQRLLALRYRHSRPGILEQTWDEREMAIADPFGNVLTFFETIPKK